MSAGTRARGRSTEARLATAADTQAILDRLEAQHPGADTELRHRNAYELLVATILSAQSTDRRVNLVTPPLFRRYPDAAALARATPAELEPQIHSAGFFRAKSKALVGMAQALVARHGGEVPASLEALTALPGVAGLAVDRHVLRVAGRIGLADGTDADTVERQLTARLPPERWTRASDTLILHGRRICRPAPLCERCAVADGCAYFRTLARTRGRRPPARSRREAAKVRTPRR
jgi:endonuclease-3